MTDKPLLDVFRGKIPKRTPIWLMRQAGRYLPEYRKVRAEAGSFLDLCYTPDFAVEVTLQPIRRYGLDAAILFSDILVVPDALGQKVDFVEGEGPKLDAVDCGGDIAKLSSDWLRSRLEPVYDAVGRIKQELPPETTFIGFAGAPWTVATYMVEGGSSKDFINTKTWMYRDPDTFQALIDIVVEGTIDHLSAQIEAGVDMVQIFDTWGGILPERAFAKWVIEPTAKIVSALKKKFPDTPVVGFPRGAGPAYIDYIEKTGVDGVSLDQAMPLKWAAENLQTRAVVQGNLDPQLLYVGGDGMIAEAKRIVSELGNGPFIFNLGHGVMKETDPDHVADLVRAVHRGG
ncbi:MAG: uroporphyrinogen decarboxylase [Alphaproteobacteria bacterium]